MSRKKWKRERPTKKDLQRNAYLDVASDVIVIDDGKTFMVGGTEMQPTWVLDAILRNLKAYLQADDDSAVSPMRAREYLQEATRLWALIVPYMSW